MVVFVSILVVAWVVFVGTWWGFTRYFRSSDVDRMKDRVMGTQKKKDDSEPGKVALFEVEHKPKGQLLPMLMKKYNLTDRARALIEQAGLKWDPTQLAQMCLGAFIATYAIAHFTLPPKLRPFVVLVAAAAGSGPIFYVIRKKAARLHAFEEIFPDSLEFISRSMRAGHAFSVSLEMIHREFAEPLSSEFRRAFEEHNLGLPIDVALQGLSRRIPVLDVHFFVSAVILQKRTGGNLAEILDKLAYVIRERFKLRGRIRAVSAHGKLTGLALTCIPIAVGVLMSFANPLYIDFFFNDEVGNMLLGAAVALQIAGYFIIQKIVKIEV